jgi:hypothetical protein
MVKSQQTRNMFDPQETNELPPPRDLVAEMRAEVLKVKDPCPRCGGRSAQSKRVVENVNLRYCCGGCLSEDRTDAFYFTPIVETFVEQVEREEAKLTGTEITREAFDSVEKIIKETPEIQEMDSILNQVEATLTIDEQAEREIARIDALETKSIKEPEQISLIDAGESWEEAWRGMPEFIQRDLQPFKSLVVHFESRDEMDAFSRLIKQKIGIDTKSIWYPEAEVNRTTNKRYVEK